MRIECTTVMTGMGANATLIKCVVGCYGGTRSGGKQREKVGYMWRVKCHGPMRLRWTALFVSAGFSIFFWAI